MSKTPSILAIDQGTTGTTSLVIAHDGRILGRAYAEFTQYFPQPGWVEHDAAEIWDVTKRVAREALASTVEADVRGLGITNQRETIVLWDRETLEPVHRAIVWQDRRTSELCSQLKERGHEPEVRRRTGLVLDPYFSATKIAWLLDHVPAARRRAEAGELATGTIDSWLLWKLTDGAVHATDVTNASRTQLFDLAKLVWTTSCWSCSMYRGRCCPTCTPAAASWPIRRPIYSVPRCRSPGSPAISKRPCSASSARAQGWRKTPTAPDVSC